MTTSWEIAALSVYHTFSLILYLLFRVSSFFDLENGIFVLVVPVPGHCLAFSLLMCM